MHKKNWLSENKNLIICIVFIGIVFVVSAVIINGLDDGEEDRFGIINEKNEFLIKEKSLENEWTKIEDNVVDFQFEGNRIAVLKLNGDLLLGSGKKVDDLTKVASKVANYQLYGEKTGYISNEKLYVSDEKGEDFFVLKENVKKFKIDQNRTVVLDKEDTLFVKDGAKSEKWEKVSDKVKLFDLYGDRIAIIVEGDAFMMKEGSYKNDWILKMDNIKDFKINDKRVAIRTLQNKLYASDYIVNTIWEEIAYNVKKFELDDRRLGVLQDVGLFRIKDGNIGSDWLMEEPDIKNFDFGKNNFCMTSAIRGVLAKDGDVQSGDWINQEFEFKKYAVAKISKKTIKDRIEQKDKNYILQDDKALQEKRIEYIFGKGKEEYKDEGEASQNIINIEVKVWKINEQNEKYPSTESVGINKKIEKEVISIFDEIFEDSEKFPIKVLYSFRWPDAKRTHPSGLAIDINSDENYYINAERLRAGKFWLPGRNQYSLSRDCSVVKAFKKRKWDWGGDWNMPKDYMHFSYIGG